MSKANNPLNDPKSRAPETRWSMAGTKRSQFNETSGGALPELGLFLSELGACRGPVHEQDRAAHNYSRFANPTLDMFQDRMALLEGAEAARGLATGMSAVTNAVMSQVRAGDHIVASRALFGGCRYVVEDFMPRFGVASTLVDGRDPENFERAMQPNTKVVFIETPTNPTLELVDIAAVAKIAHAHGAKLIVDNVFATALLPEAAAARGGPRHLFGDQAYRRPGPRAGRHRAGQQGADRGRRPHLPPPDRAVAVSPSMPGCCSRASKPCRCASGR